MSCPVQRSVRITIPVARRQHVSHRPVGPEYEDLRRRLKSILSIFNRAGSESTDTDVAGLEQSHSGPAGREPDIQTERYRILVTYDL